MRLSPTRKKIIGRLLLRLVSLGVFLWIMTGVIFISLQFLPGDPTDVILGSAWSPTAAAALRIQLGLNKPLIIQWFDWTWAALHGSLGTSYLTKQPVTSELASAIPNSLILAFGSLFLSLAIGIPLGILTAIKKDGWFDNVVRGFVIIGISVPIYLLAYILMLVFGVYLRLLPVTGLLRGPEGFILPMVTLTIFLIPGFTKITRAAMIEIIDKDYIRTARSKGLPERIVMLKHALRNGMIPIITLSGVQLAQLIGSDFLVEYVFAFPGVGYLMIESIFGRDRPVVIGAMIVAAGALLLASWTVDLLYALVDPRIRREAK